MMTSSDKPIGILVVDYQPSFRARLQSQLETEGYRVLTAPDAEAGIAAAKATHPDLIILDVVLPGINGIEACRRLKASPDVGHVPIIILTASSHPQISDEGYQAGAEGVLRKYEEPELLLKAVRLALSRRGRMAAIQTPRAEGAGGEGASPARPRGSAGGFERRRSPRAYPFGPLADAFTAAIPLRLLNLSTGGALVEHEAPLGGEFTLVLRQGPSGPALTVRCHVVHSLRVGGSGGEWRYRTGVDFGSLSPEEATTLSEWVAHLGQGDPDPTLAI